MTNEILKFGDTATNILTQAQYAADTQRNIGNQPGIARSALVNKAMRQSAFVVNALSQLIEDVTGANILDDDNSAVYKTNLQALIQQLANKEVAFKDPVEYATTANITLSALQNIDGGTGVANQRILVKNQTTASENGIYLQQVGSWTRATDFDGSDEVEPGTTIPVAFGTTNGATAWILTTMAPIVIGVTNLSFTLLAGAGGITSLTGEATAGINGITTLVNSAVIGKVLTGFTSGAGTVTAADSLLTAIQKIDGNTQSAGAGVGGAYGLKIEVTSNTSTSIIADQIVLLNGLGGSYIANAVNITNTITTSGAGGLDTGAEAASIWYYVWVIYNGSTVSSILSASSTTPTMPVGYTFKTRIGAIRNNASSDLLRSLQYGNEAIYVVGTNPVNKIIMQSGNTGGTVAVSVSNFVPPTAYKINVIATNANFSDTFVQPSAAWGGTSTTNFVEGVIGSLNSRTASIILESSNIYFSGSGVESSVAVYGWTDNLNAGSGGNIANPSGILLSTTIASNSATIDIGLPAGYEGYRLVIKGLTCSNNNILRARLRTTGGSVRSGASDYTYANHISNTGGGSGSGAGSAASSAMDITSSVVNISNVAGGSVASDLTILNAYDTSLFTDIGGTMRYQGVTNAMSSGYTGGNNNTAESNDLIRFLMSSGNIITGTFLLYSL
jgi:hypothetical protein